MGNKALKQEGNRVGDVPPSSQKAVVKAKGGKVKVTIPEDSPLGYVVKHWKDLGKTKLDVVRMINLCEQTWIRFDLGSVGFPYLGWPPNGSCTDEMNYAMTLYFKNNPEATAGQEEYWMAWRKLCNVYRRAGLGAPKIGVYSVLTKECPKEKSEWDVLDNLPPTTPPPYNPNANQQDHEDLGANVNQEEEEEEEGEIEGAVGGVEQEKEFSPPGVKTRKKGKVARQMPLRQVPIGNGELGYVEAPLTAAELRAFKMQLPKFSEAPEKFVNDLEGLLGTSTFSPKELRHILVQLVGNEKFHEAVDNARKMWTAEEEARTPAGAELQFPYEQPDNFQAAAQVPTCTMYQKYVLKGLRQAAPRVVNLEKAFGVPQKPGEDSDEFLKRLKLGMQQYAGMDPDAPVNQSALKLHFIEGSAPDVKKKLQKIENLTEKSLADLVREGQKVIARREVVKERRQVKMMAQTAWEVQRQSMGRGVGRGFAPRGGAGGRGGFRQGRGGKWLDVPKDCCNFCGKKGHYRRDCEERKREEGKKEEKGAQLKELYRQAVQFEEESD